MLNYRTAYNPSCEGIFSTEALSSLGTLTLCQVGMKSTSTDLKNGHPQGITKQFQLGVSCHPAAETKLLRPGNYKQHTVQGEGRDS